MKKIYTFNKQKEKILYNIYCHLMEIDSLSGDTTLYICFVSVLKKGLL